MATTGRRDAGAGSVYKDKNGYWRASIELGWERGKRRRKVITGKTKADVVEKLKTYRKQLDTTGTVALNVPKVDAWLKRWVDDIASLRLKPRTVMSYRSEVNKHINPWLGHHRLDKLNASHIVDWHTKLRKEPNARDHKRPMAEASVLKAHAVLSRALEDAVRLDLIPRNPAKNVDRPKKRARDERQALSTDDALALLRHVRDHPLGSRWAAALMLGSRQGETLGLEWDRVDLVNNIVELSWQLQRIPYAHGCADENPCGRKFAGNCPQRRLDVAPDYEFKRVDGGLCLLRPKNEKPRITPMPPQLLAWLRQEHGGVPRGRFVWQRPNGKPIDPRADHTASKALLASLGHHNTTLHEMRHTTASLLQRLGVPEPIRMQIMGHSVAATQRGYAHVDTELMNNAMALLDEALAIEALPELEG